MSAKLRAHFRSNVVGYLALFVALGGTSAYATHAINTVTSEDIVNLEVKNPDIGPSAVSSTKIGAGAVTSTGLGTNSVTSIKVPFNGLTGSDIDELTLTGIRGLTCPSTMLLHEGACIEKNNRTATTWLNASDTCKQLGRRLPSLEELTTFRVRPNQNMGPGVYEFTQYTYADKDGGDTVRTNLIEKNGTLSRRSGLGSSSPSNRYRCVATPT